MTLRVRDKPPGIRFSLTRNRHKFTMICQHEDHRYLYRVIAHAWVDKRAGFVAEREASINGQSFAKPFVRALL